MPSLSHARNVQWTFQRSTNKVERDIFSLSGSRMKIASLDTFGHARVLSLLGESQKLVACWASVAKQNNARGL